MNFNVRILPIFYVCLNTLCTPRPRLQAQTVILRLTPLQRSKNAESVEKREEFQRTTVYPNAKNLFRVYSHHHTGKKGTKGRKGLEFSRSDDEQRAISLLAACF